MGVPWILVTCTVPPLATAKFIRTPAPANATSPGASACDTLSPAPSGSVDASHPAFTSIFVSVPAFPLTRSTTVLLPVPFTNRQ